MGYNMKKIIITLMLLAPCVANAGNNVDYQKFDLQKPGLWEDTNSMIAGSPPGTPPIVTKYCITDPKIIKQQILNAINFANLSGGDCKSAVEKDTATQVIIKQNCVIDGKNTQTITELEKVSDVLYKNTSDYIADGQHTKGEVVSKYLGECTAE
jgi:hypothetical protein